MSTDSRIHTRLPAARSGRTTVVATTSPLLLRHADDVALVLDGRLVATGTHEQLMADEPRYREVVVRSDSMAEVTR